MSETQISDDHKIGLEEKVKNTKTISRLIMIYHSMLNKNMRMRNLLTQLQSRLL